MTRSRVVAAVCLVLALLAPRMAAQQGVFLGRVEGVRIDAIVTDGRGPVAGLSVVDFDVSDNGVRQQVDSVELAGRVALAVVLDTSASVRFGTAAYPDRTVQPGFARLVDAARLLLAALGPEDEVGLLTTGSQLVLRAPISTNRASVARVLAELVAIQRPGLEPLSPVWDAVLAGAALVADRPGRPVVVLLSDGIDNASWLEQGAAERALQRVGVTVEFIAVPRTYPCAIGPCAIDLGPAGRPHPDSIARATGGERVEADDERLAGRLATRLEELRSSYVITYTPTGVGRDDGWHDVKITLVGRSGRVRARPGYHAGTGR